VILAHLGSGLVRPYLQQYWGKKIKTINKHDSRNKVIRYLFICYLLNLLLCINFALVAAPKVWSSQLFTLILTITYPLFYMSPTIFLAIACHKLISVSRIFEFVFYGILGSSNALVFALLFFDIRLFDLYGFHINGFVINLLITKGGIESLGGSLQTYITAGALGLGILSLHMGLLLIVLKSKMAVLPAKSLIKIVFISFAVLTLSEKIAYGFSDAKKHAPILKVATEFPLYNQITFRSLLKRMGMELEQQSQIQLKENSSALHYPLTVIKGEQIKKPYNIIWLVSESLRWDMLSPEIMPETYLASNKAWRFENHYSGGNGTRQGMFSLFYGIYGSYWDSFLMESRSPVLLDLLQEKNYQFEMFTSASFTYPEFDQTLFANIPPSHLHSIDTDMTAWKRDESNTKALIETIKNHDKSKPFMNFMFFESTHARYDFPEKLAIKEPYLHDLNYATMTRKSLAPKINELKNRYINSSNFVDTQIAKLFKTLKDEDLWQNTIVLVTGDHGEEFMEKGFWGHNSGFSEEQIRTPMMLWIPGKKPRLINEVTSHIDIVPTILALLGIDTPISAYSSGVNLAKKIDREYIVVSDWRGIAYLGGGYKFTLPFTSSLNSNNQLFDSADSPSEDIVSFITGHKVNIDEALRSSNKFRER
jgi:membrane-anchored protein YejM (alkaline phosphatase superfamily)